MAGFHGDCRCGRPLVMTGFSGGKPVLKCSGCVKFPDACYCPERK
jgi:hypothetical protein